MNTTLFEDTYICRYVISLYPDSQRPSLFIAALNAMFPMLTPIAWTEEAPDLRRRVAEFLNAAVRGTASRKLLLILDGAHHLDYSGQNAFSLAEILPQASQLTQGVYLFLTDQCAEDHTWLMSKDTAPYIGTFLLSTPQHQQFFRVYLTQYVLSCDHRGQSSGLRALRIPPGRYASGASPAGYLCPMPSGFLLPIWCISTNSTPDIPP